MTSYLFSRGILVQAHGHNMVPEKLCVCVYVGEWVLLCLSMGKCSNEGIAGGWGGAGCFLVFSGQPGFTYF